MLAKKVLKAKIQDSRVLSASITNTTLKAKLQKQSLSARLQDKKNIKVMMAWWCIVYNDVNIYIEGWYIGYKQWDTFHKIIAISELKVQWEPWYTPKKWIDYFDWKDGKPWKDGIWKDWKDWFSAYELWKLEEWNKGKSINDFWAWLRRDGEQIVMAWAMNVVPTWWTTGQVLKKKSNNDFDLEWGTWGWVVSIVAWDDIDIDNTDPLNPIVSLENDITINSIQFDTTPTTITPVAWDVIYNIDEDTLDLTTNHNTYQLWQETALLYKNQSWVTIFNATPVTSDGAVWASWRVKIKKAIANWTQDPHLFLWLTTEDITNGNDWKATWYGKVRGINTTWSPYGETWVEGNELYVSPTTAWGITNVMPQAPNLQIFIGYVVNVHAVNGTILVKPSWNPKLIDLSDVNGTPLTTTWQIPVWNNTAGYFDFTENTNNFALKATTLTINGTTYDLSMNRSWTIPTTSPWGLSWEIQYNNAWAFWGLSTATYPSIAELAYVKGVTSSIQTQLNSKLSAITVWTTTITSGTNKAIQYNNSWVYAETLFRYDNVNARLWLGIAVPLYSLDFAYSGAWTNSTWAIRIADNQTWVLPWNNIVALNIEFNQTSWGWGIWWGTKTWLRIAQSWLWSHNIWTQVLGLDIPAYSGSVYANYKVWAYIGDKVVIGNRALQNNDHILQILATWPSSAFTSQATIGFDWSATNTVRSGLTVFQSNTGNIWWWIHFIRTWYNLWYDIEFSNIEWGGYVQGVKMRMFNTTGSITVGSATDFSTRFAIVSATQPQLATYYNASNYMRVTTGSTGITTFDAVWASARFVFADSIYLRAGTATVWTAPLYMTSWPLLTAPVIGANEFLTDDYYYTITTGTARKRVVLEDTVLVAWRVPFATTNGRLTDDADITFSVDTLTVTKIKSWLVESTWVTRLKWYTVATLPAWVIGDTAYVTDALAPTFLAPVVGWGAIVTTVFYDWANWIT